MGESKKVVFLVIFMIFLALIGIFLSKNDVRIYISDLYADYTATLYISEDFYLKEEYIYYPQKNKFKMLYRNWRVPLTYGEELKRPFIRVEDVISLNTTYLKDWQGKVYILSGEYSQREENVVRSEADVNEIGTLNINKFSQERVTLKASYYLYPPVHDDGEYQHINIKLADRHVFYRNVTLRIVDEKGIIDSIYPHLPNFEAYKEGNVWIIKGIAPENSLVEIEVLLRGLVGMHFFEPAAYLKSKVELVNKEFADAINFRNSIYDIFSVAVFIFPIITFLIYKIYGKEKPFTVPEFISFVPNSGRKPWFVNMIFNGDATVTDENAYYSTLLDLERRGLVNIKEEEGDLRIKINSIDTKDPYEKKVLLFLSKNINQEGFFSSKEMERKIREAVKFKNKNFLKTLKKEIDSIYKFSDKGTYSHMIDLKGFYIIRILGILTLLCISGIFVYLHFKKNVYTYDIVVLGSFLIAISNLPHLLLPSQIFGRWKSDFYKERLEWESFKRFLSDLAMLKKYEKEDISLWKEWLYYGTALGVADNIERALSSLKINVPELKKVRYVRRYTHYYYRALNDGIRSISSSSKSSGFGVGGGFGGGGAGGR